MSGSSSSATERPHVLVVSDDEGLVDFLSEGLVFGGFWSSHIASGIQTLEVFRLRSFDAVLIDAALPGLSAIDVVRRLRSASADDESPGPRTDVPIIVIVAVDSEASLDEVLSAGADDRWLAPLDIEDVVPKLHAVVAGWRRRHPDRPFSDAAGRSLNNRDI